MSPLKTILSDVVAVIVCLLNKVFAQINSSVKVSFSSNPDWVTNPTGVIP